MDGIESEQVADMFLCCVCLDLLYKPVVLACGHTSCFWCVHKSMSAIHQSHCPMCRHPYCYFPTICQLLHTLIMKMYPLTYKMREKQILEEEKEIGHSSPNIEGFRASQEANSPTDLYKTDPRGQHSMCGASSTIVELQKSSKDTLYQISIDDVLCPTCKQLLFRPVVLNCGHVYCESCIGPVDGSLRCQICRSPHPKGFPKVYLDLDHLLEEHFTKEYEARKITKKVHIQYENEVQSSGSSSTKVAKNGLQIPPASLDELWCVNNNSKLHFGVGCDYCGMYPIIGERYKCKDCKETIGFDLCENCYNTQSKLPGRFNQQHTLDHSFVIEKSYGVYNTILQFLRSPSDIGIPPQHLGTENGEITIPNLNELGQETVENAENSLVPALETMEIDEIVVIDSSTSGSTDGVENAENSVMLAEESKENVEIVVINSSTSGTTEDQDQANID